MADQEGITRDEFSSRWPDYEKALGARGPYNPALGRFIASDPVAAINLAIQRGMNKPPPADIPEGTPPHEAVGALGRHLSGPMAYSPNQGQEMGPAAPSRLGRIPRQPLEVVPGDVSGPLAPESLSSVPMPRPRLGPQVKDEERAPLTPSQQGAEEVPVPRRNPPIVAPESTQGTESGTTPAPNTSQNPPEGKDGKPKEEGETTEGEEKKKKKEGLELGSVLAGLSAIKPPAIPHLATPAPYHATNQISRSNIPQVLMAELTGAAKPNALLRLGQALKGG